MRRFVTGWAALLVAILTLTVLQSAAEGPPDAVPEDGSRIHVPEASKSRPAGPDEQALREVLERGRARVGSISEQLRTATDPDQRLVLQKRVIETKTQTRLEFLRLKADLARRDGDLRAEKRALLLIEIIEHPPRPVPSMHLRQSPQKRVLPEKGESR